MLLKALNFNYLIHQVILVMADFTIALLEISNYSFLITENMVLFSLHDKNTFKGFICKSQNQQD